MVKVRYISSLLALILILLLLVMSCNPQKEPVLKPKVGSVDQFKANLLRKSKENQLGSKSSISSLKSTVDILSGKQGVSDSFLKCLQVRAWMLNLKSYLRTLGYLMMRRK
ncbi:hypothetical protein bcCo53_001263 (plasmid) [Borrelia coriaceae]|uniref:hypothetical protein n=1 Tax=Borrelia coriaceae TaxID=144 RepID=UPI00046D6D2B|nr:hypothetical protein [Borrelia coriaceae]UPA17094.1 hypothetical protein bcCo53_001263 [Borrelia coriaceae]